MLPVSHMRYCLQIHTDLWIDAQIKQAALDEAPFAGTEAWAEDVAQSEPGPPESEPTSAIATDPTIAHAGLNELTVPVNGGAEPADTSDAPPGASVDAGAANEAGGNWDKEHQLGRSTYRILRDGAEGPSGGGDPYGYRADKQHCQLG